MCRKMTELLMIVSQSKLVTVFYLNFQEPTYLGVTQYLPRMLNDSTEMLVDLGVCDMHKLFDDVMYQVAAEPVYNYNILNFTSISSTIRHLFHINVITITICHITAIHIVTSLSLQLSHHGLSNCHINSIYTVTMTAT